ncbi:MAG: hypothetical protein ILO68_06680 [Clostridia bacterium]|nr:hypothetical protein [Clostridia bacterium]
MSNKEIYKRTLTFSIRGIVIDLIILALIAGLAGAGYLLMEKVNDKGLIGLIIGLIIGIIIAAVIAHFFSYALKAGQIAMMTKAVTEGELPENVYQEGKRVVKERFGTVAAYYAVTNVIKGIFRQIGNGISRVGNAVGGDTGNAIGSAISAAINTLVAYLCDCCLGWVFFRKEQGSVKATLEGAALFFRHGKVFAKNMGRIFGMGLVSLLLIGGAFFGVFALIFMNLPTAFEKLTKEVIEAAARAGNEIPAFLQNPTNFALVAAAVVGVCIWSFIHSKFIRPFVLTGVLRNYLEAGMADQPTQSDFAEMERKYPKFAELQKKLGKA